MQKRHHAGMSLWPQTQPLTPALQQAEPGNAALLQQRTARGSCSQSNAERCAQLAERQELPDLDLHHAIYEQLAHHFVYLHFPKLYSGQSQHAGLRLDADGSSIERWDLDDRSHLAELGYRVEEVIDDPFTGFQAALFLPTRNGVVLKNGGGDTRLMRDLRPVVAFRGSQDARSWADDYNPEGIGTHQFRMNEARITAMLVRAGKDGTPPDVVGHSLGGALAQLTAAHYPRYVNDVVTFQAPGIGEEQAEWAEDGGVDATHYRVKGDVVPTTGEAHIWGMTSCYTMGNVPWAINPFQGPMGRASAAHCAWPLQAINAARTDQRRPWHIPALLKDNAGENFKGTSIHESNRRWEGQYIDGHRGEERRKTRIDARRFSTAEDYLNGPLVRVADRLQPRIQEALCRGDDIEQIEAELRTFVYSQEQAVIQQAREEWWPAWWKSITIDPSRTIPGVVWSDPSESQIEDMESRLARVFPDRAERLISENVALAQMQKNGQLVRLH